MYSQTIRRETSARERQQFEMVLADESPYDFQVIHEDGDYPVVEFPNLEAERGDDGADLIRRVMARLGWVAP